MDKKTLRKRFMALREAMPGKLYRERSEAIANKVINSAWFEEADTIHCFASMEKRREPNTFTIMEAVWKAGKTLVLPRVVEGKDEFELVEAAGYGDLSAGKWGILEPAGRNYVKPEIIDLVLVPMLAADAGFNRLGYGKGYYDRFLKKVTATRAGLVFEEFIVKKLPSDPHDVPMDVLFSEEQIRTR